MQRGVRKRIAPQMLSAHGNSYALAMRAVHDMLRREAAAAGADGMKSMKHIWHPRLEIRIRKYHSSNSNIDPTVWFY